MNKKRKIPWWGWLLIGLGVIGIGVGIWLGRWSYLIAESQQPVTTYDPGTWIELAPEGIVSANGEPVYSEMRLGSENKVIVFFYGGGLCVNDFTATHPYTGARLLPDENGFYTADIDGMIPDYLELGIGSARQENPFRDWTIIVIPYATADFHLGTADRAYTAQDGTTQLVRHHGYTNYRAIMDEAAAYLDEAPEELLVAGYSAGGFGAAALAGDVLENYFPEAGGVTVCIDSALLIWPRFPEAVGDIWGVPEEIAARFQTENPIVDLLSSLYDTYGEGMTYLYVGSVRDGELARYQNYFYTGRYAVANENGWMFTEDLKATIGQLRQAVPTLEVYLFDGLPFSIRPYQIFLTQHTILETIMFSWPLTERVSVSYWLMRAVRGDARSYGLSLLAGRPGMGFFR